jgi:D-psicose/D-tagatose/L-ribulose 3-epimerase
MRLSIISSYFGPEEEGLPRLAALGYRHLEAGRREDTAISAARFVEVAADCGMQIHSVMSWHGGIADADEGRRRKVFDGLLSNIEWAAELGAKVLEVVPMWRGPAEEREEAWSRAVEALARASDRAGQRGVTLAIEPVSFQQSDLVHTLAQAVVMAHETGADCVKVMGDTHHMHLTERDIPRAIREAGPWLVNFHLSDNNRLPPGLGQMDLVSIVRALAEVDYRGSLSLSEMAKVPDAETAARLAHDLTQSLIEICELRESLMRSGRSAR